MRDRMGGGIEQRTKRRTTLLFWLIWWEWWKCWWLWALSMVMIPSTKRWVIWNIVGQGWREQHVSFFVTEYNGLCWQIHTLCMAMCTYISIYVYSYMSKNARFDFLIVITNSLLLFSSNFGYSSLSLLHEATYFSIQISFSVMKRATFEHYEICHLISNVFFCQMCFFRFRLHVPSWVFLPPEEVIRTAITWKF